MGPKTQAKPLTQRPLDLLYYSFFFIHLVCTVLIDVLPLWPAQAQTTPGLSHLYGFLKAVVDDYTKKSNDPFMLATWGLTPRDYEFAHMKVFMWMEVFIQLPSFVIGMWGLQKNTPTIYPLLLAYSSAALVTTITVTHGALTLPSLAETTDPLAKFYALSDSARMQQLGPLIPFLLVPAVMWVDMMVRVGKLVSAGAKGQAQRPLDLLYYSFFLIHLACSALIDCLPLWPAQAQTIPGLSQFYAGLKAYVDDYTENSNDPFMLATWGLTPRDYEFAHLKVFMWIEAFVLIPTFVIGLWGLQNKTPSIYPLLLAYSSAALVTNITAAHGMYTLPALTETTDPLAKFYAVSDSARTHLLGPLIPFLIVPAVMWVDMMMRVGKLVSAGAKVQARGKVANGKGSKEL